MYAKIVSVCRVSNAIASNVWMSFTAFSIKSHISLKNIGRLEILSHHARNDIRQLATLLLEVARVKPCERRRWKFLAQNQPLLTFKELFGDYVPDDVVPDDVVDSLADPDLADSDLPY
jgi:hypothetical protein